MVKQNGHCEHDVALFFLVLFSFDFVHSHALCDCCSIVCLRFQVTQIKQVDYKMSLKKVFLRKHFVISEVSAQP